MLPFAHSVHQALCNSRLTQPTAHVLAQYILSPVHWVGVEPTTLRDETSGRTTTNSNVSVVLVLLGASFLPDANDLGDAWNPPRY